MRFTSQSTFYRHIWTFLVSRVETAQCRGYNVLLKECCIIERDCVVNTVPRVQYFLKKAQTSDPSTQLKLYTTNTMNRPLRSSAVHEDLPLSLLRLISMADKFNTHSGDPLCKHIEQFICVEYTKTGVCR